MRVAGGGLTFDLWHDATMTNFVRVRAGATADVYVDHRDDGNTTFAMTPITVLEADFTFDDDGFHHLTFHSGWEAPFELLTPDVTRMRQRFLNELAYEVIVLAINDQPISLRASVGGGYRDDLIANNGWEVVAGLGLRASLWAPAPE